MTTERSAMSDLDSQASGHATAAPVSGQDPPSAGRSRTAGSRLMPYLPYAAAVAATLYVCRGVFVGRLFGDVGDARWTVALHEHWFRVWQGKEAIRDLVSYVPLKNVLGTSDAFFVQGQIYSALRALRVDLTSAWAVTQILFFLVGALGVAALARHLLRLAVSQSALVVLVCASYPLLVDILHVQLIGMLSCSWVALGILDVVTGRHAVRGLGLVLLVPPLIALSSWYALILFVVVLAFVAFYLAVLGNARSGLQRTRWAAASVRAAVKSRAAVVTLLAATIASALLWAMAVWIYVPAKNLLPKPTWLETTIYAPRLSDVLNAAEAGGGVWGRLYARFFDPATYNFEQPRGFTPILFVVLVGLGLYNVRRATLGRPSSPSALPGPRALTAMWLAVLSVVLFFLVDERDLGLFQPVWTLVPGMDSIRAPFRVQTIDYALAFVVVLRSAELIHDRVRAHCSRRSRTIVGKPLTSTAIVSVCVVVCALLFLEGQRSLLPSWAPAELLRPGLVAQIPAVQASCDAVIVEPQPGVDKVQVQIDAVILATLSGLVTPQGYGRAEPIGHPRWDGTTEELAAWMREQGFTGRMCRVSPTGVQALAR